MPPVTRVQPPPAAAPQPPLPPFGKPPATDCVQAGAFCDTELPLGMYTNRLWSVGGVAAIAIVVGPVAETTPYDCPPIEIGVASRFIDDATFKVQAWEMSTVCDPTDVVVTRCPAS
jgi:hypothetical protein